MDVISKQVDVVPLVKHYIEEIGLHEIFDRHVPSSKGADIKPAKVLCTLITNILVSSDPLYKIEEWLTDYTDGKTEAQAIAIKYNDDRCARDLDRLYEADRHSIMTEAVSSAIKIYNLDTDTIHNDSTSVTFSGRYDDQSPDAVQLEPGHNKDHRPDLKQIVFGLNITEDGHVPLSYQAYNGATSDSVTHQNNWDRLRAFIGKEDFIYIADCKLYSRENLQHIDAHHGRFITLVPKNIKEVKQFIERVKAGETLDWAVAYEVESSRKKGKKEVFKTYDGETSAEGYRIVWVHSSAKDIQDKKAREARLKKAEKTLEALSGKLNRYYLKTPEQIKKAVEAMGADTAGQLMVDIKEEETTEIKQAGPGRSGANTHYKENTNITYRLLWHRNEQAIERESRADGLFPLVTNDKNIGSAEVLRYYKQQPFLEKRFNTGKSILEVTPIFLHKNERIEATLFLYFIALMILSLIERNIRQQMREQNIGSLPIRPTGLRCEAPTWNTIRYFFRNIYLAVIMEGTRMLSAKIKGVTPLHKKLLTLLKVPESNYVDLKDDWWEYDFSP